MSSCSNVLLGCWYALIIFSVVLFCNVTSASTPSKLRYFCWGSSWIDIFFLLMMATPPDAIVSGLSLSDLIMLYPGMLKCSFFIKWVSLIQAISTLFLNKNSMKVDLFCLIPSAFQLTIVRFVNDVLLIFK